MLLRLYRARQSLAKYTISKYTLQSLGAQESAYLRMDISNYMLVPTMNENSTFIVVTITYL